MQKYWILAAYALAIAPLLDCSHAYNINQNTRDVYHRFYIINRLKMTLDFLAENQETLTRNLHYELFDAVHWRHPEMQKVVHTMLQQKLLEPLFGLWKKICSYRYMYDDLLESEFACIVLLICQQINVEEALCNRNILQKNVTTDDIAHNFYIINRLKKPVAMLCAIYEQSSPLFDQEPKKNGEPFFEEFKDYGHNRISDCIQEIQNTHSFTPIKRVYKECAQYRYAGDDAFLREQLCLLFFAYKVMLSKKLSNQSEQVIMHEMDTIQYITQNLDEFSTDQILVAIDMMTDKLSTIHNLEKRGKSSLSKRLYLVSLPIITIASIWAVYHYLIKR